MPPPPRRRRYRRARPPDGFAPRAACPWRDLAVIQRHHAIGHLRHQRHVVLDHDHGDAEILLDVLDPEPHAFGLFDIQAGRRLIQQQQFRFGAQRAAEFDDFAHAVRQIGDQRVAIALQIEERDDLLDLFPMLDFRAAGRRQEGDLRQDSRRWNGSAGRSAGSAAASHWRTARCSETCARCRGRRCGAAAVRVMSLPSKIRLARRRCCRSG